MLQVVPLPSGERVRVRDIVFWTFGFCNLKCIDYISSWFKFFNLGILGNLVHFRHLNFALSVSSVVCFENT